MLNALSAPRPRLFLPAPGHRPPPPSSAAAAASAARSAVASPAPQKKARRRRRSKQQPEQLAPGGDGPRPSSPASVIAAASAAEKALRLAFMEELMTRARSGDVAGVSEIIYDMIAAGLSPGPRSFHGLVVSHVLNGDAEGAVMHE